MYSVGKVHCKWPKLRFCSKTRLSVGNFHEHLSEKLIQDVKEKLSLCLYVTVHVPSTTSLDTDSKLVIY